MRFVLLTRGKIMQVLQKGKMLLMCALMGCALIFNHNPAGATGQQSDNTKDMVWAASDGVRHAIYISTWSNNNWSDPVKVTTDNTDNITPCIDVAADGTKYLVWTTVDTKGHRIRYAVYSGNSWSAPKELPDQPEGANAPFIAVDDASVAWVVFTGNDGVDDDIYCSRFVKGAWSKPSRVNAPNQTPDMNPYIEITASNTVVATWQGFREEGYTMLQSVWSKGKWQAEEPAAAEDAAPAEEDATATQDTIPDFVVDKRQVFTRSYTK